MKIEKQEWSVGSKTRKHPILLLHGAWHGSWCWDLFGQKLAAQGFFVRAISLPGHGGSPKMRRFLNFHSLKDYVQVLHDQVERLTPKPIVIAHSMGGAITQRYIEHHRLPGAILLASIPIHGLIPMIFLRTFWHHPMVTTGALFGFPKLLVQNVARAKRLFTSGRCLVNFDEFHRKLSGESYRVLFSLMWPWTLRARKVSTPVCVIAASEDRLFWPWEQARTAKALGAPPPLISVGDGHDLMIEPGMPRIVEHIESWLGSQGIA